MLSIDLNTNLMSLMMQSNLNKTTNLLSSSMEKLSSGKKINSAADGAAQLAISEKLSAQISGTAVAQENVQQGKLMLDQADSSLQKINDNLSAIRDLAVQAANSTLSQDERDMLKIEAQSRMEQINSIAQSATFNDVQLLDGTVTSFQLQVGANSDNVMDISKALVNAEASSYGLTSAVINTAFSSATNASSFIDTIDTAMSSVASNLATVGAYSNSLDSTLDNLAIKQINLEASHAEIIDVDYASELSNYLQLQILQQAQVSLLSQANTQQTFALSLL